MALEPTTMVAQMLARAVSQGLIDTPPYFGLSRTYSIIARGIIEALLSQTSTVVTVVYGPGQPAIGFGVAGPTVGWDGLDPERYWPLIQTATGYFGPQAQPFFFGLGGVVEHIQQSVIMNDFFVPTGNGVGLLSPGGVLLNADDVFDEMHEAAVAEGLMVVRLKAGPDDILGHVSDPLDTFADPITGDPLAVGDLFTRAEILLRAASIQLS